MKTITRFMYVFFLAAAIVGCTSDDDSGAGDEPQFNLDDLQGKWYRAYSNNPSADGMEVTVTNDQGKVTNPANSSFTLNSVKWKDIIATAQNEFEHKELGTDGNYYEASMELGQDDTLRIYVGHSSVGNAQKWVRTYTEPEINECTPYDASSTSGVISGNWTDSSEVDEYIGLLPAVADPAGGFYTITITTEGVNPWIDISKSGTDNTVINGSNGGGSNVRSVAFSTEPGISYDLYLHPFTYEGGEWPRSYTISWEYTGIMDCYESNDTFGDAKFIPKGETIEAFANWNYEGDGSFENYSDIYKVVINEPLKLQFELSQSPSDNFIYMRFHREDESTIIATTNYVSGDHTIPGSLYTQTTDSVLNPGVYYIRTYAYHSGHYKADFDSGDSPRDTWMTPYKFKVTAVQ